MIFIYLPIYSPLFFFFLGVAPRYVLWNIVAYAGMPACELVACSRGYVCRPDEAVQTHESQLLDQYYPLLTAACASDEDRKLAVLCATHTWAYIHTFPRGQFMKKTSLEGKREK